MDLPPVPLLHNRYLILRLLGKGGKGAVYLAHDQSLDHEVAVNINLTSSPESAAQFKNEARLLATLRHPNLPRVIDYFIEGEKQFLAMTWSRPGRQIANGWPLLPNGMEIQRSTS